MNNKNQSYQKTSMPKVEDYLFSFPKIVSVWYEWCTPAMLNKCTYETLEISYNGFTEFLDNLHTAASERYEKELSSQESQRILDRLNTNGTFKDRQAMRVSRIRENAVVYGNDLDELVSLCISESSGKRVVAEVLPHLIEAFSVVLPRFRAIVSLKKRLEALNPTFDMLNNDRIQSIRVPKSGLLLLTWYYEDYLLELVRDMMKWLHLSLEPQSWLRLKIIDVANDLTYYPTTMEPAISLLVSKLADGEKEVAIYATKKLRGLCSQYETVAMTDYEEEEYIHEQEEKQKKKIWHPKKLKNGDRLMLNSRRTVAVPLIVQNAVELLNKSHTSATAVRYTIAFLATLKLLPSETETANILADMFFSLFNQQLVLYTEGFTSEKAEEIRAIEKRKAKAKKHGKANKKKTASEEYDKIKERLLHENVYDVSVVKNLLLGIENILPNCELSQIKRIDDHVAKLTQLARSARYPVALLASSVVLRIAEQGEINLESQKKALLYGTNDENNTDTIEKSIKKIDDLVNKLSSNALYAFYHLFNRPEASRVSKTNRAAKLLEGAQRCMKLKLCGVWRDPDCQAAFLKRALQVGLFGECSVFLIGSMINLCNALRDNFSEDVEFGFAKRLYDMDLADKNLEANPLDIEMNKIYKKYPFLDANDTEQQKVRKSDGVQLKYDYEGADPRKSLAATSPMWEACAMADSFHPSVATLAEDTLFYSHGIYEEKICQEKNVERSLPILSQLPFINPSYFPDKECRPYAGEPITDFSFRIFLDCIMRGKHSIELLGGNNENDKIDYSSQPMFVKNLYNIYDMIQNNSSSKKKKQKKSDVDDAEFEKLLKNSKDGAIYYPDEEENDEEDTEFEEIINKVEESENEIKTDALKFLDKFENVDQDDQEFIEENEDIYNDDEEEEEEEFENINKNADYEITSKALLNTLKKQNDKYMTPEEFKQLLTANKFTESVQKATAKHLLSGDNEEDNVFGEESTDDDEKDNKESKTNTADVLEPEFNEEEDGGLVTEIGMKEIYDTIQERNKEIQKRFSDRFFENGMYKEKATKNLYVKDEKNERNLEEKEEKPDYIDDNEDIEINRGSNRYNNHNNRNENRYNDRYDRSNSRNNYKDRNNDRNNKHNSYKDNKNNHRNNSRSNFGNNKRRNDSNHNNKRGFSNKRN